MKIINYKINGKVYETDGISIRLRNNHRNGFVYVKQLSKKHQDGINLKISHIK